MKLGEDSNGPPESEDFIRAGIRSDLESGMQKPLTRFPPEPNGYLHIGHAKSICLNFGVAEEFGGKCNLRFDDTNPSKEDVRYEEAIKEDVKWLGFDWGGKVYYASDYFGRLYEYALRLVSEGKAYVDDLSTEQIREYRGTLSEPGRESPSRARSVEENMRLLRAMRAGKFDESQYVLRAKIDMASGNMNMRDPVMYRIMKRTHPRTGNSWPIYPMYDWAHGQSDSIEGVTHSLCTLEFEDHRPLYDWFITQLGIYHSRQIEFARLNLSYTILSKRSLMKLVSKGFVSGWDDPRMPTVSGLRRRGYTPESIRNFCRKIGVTKQDSIIDMGFLEHSVREDLNRKAQRVMAVLDPLKVVIVNYPEDQEEEIEAVNNPEDSSMGKRKVPFSRELFIERDDFMENPPKKFHRLSPGSLVRLRYAYIVRCKGFERHPSTGKVTEVYCEYYPATRGGNTSEGTKVRGTIHWVCAKRASRVTVRLYDRLFTVPNPMADRQREFTEFINPDSLHILENCAAEPALGGCSSGINYQFERKGYFVLDPEDSEPGAPVFNRTVSLRDSWTRRSGGKVL
ncbi:MAG: glutamine--tRNA ligase/YqeY domain fusion protein [Candidatus Dadabacteria bacterium]|nr:glutamine--tRNA ligase/YqeY domain fusion protein [Candidatus Dadabacteria bacterium]